MVYQTATAWQLPYPFQIIVGAITLFIPKLLEYKLIEALIFGSPINQLIDSKHGGKNYKIFQGPYISYA